MKRIILYFLLALSVTQFNVTPADAQRRFFHATNPAVSSFDSDAQAFFTAASITDATQKTAINTLVVAAKANGWWTLCSAIYPMVGGNATAHAVNLKSPGTYDLTFNGGWTHSATGALPNGTTGWANTHLTPSTNLSSDDNHISIYSRTNIGGNDAYYDIGSAGGGNYMAIRARRSSDVYSGYNQTDGSFETTFSNTDSRGFYLDTRTGSTTQTAYKNGISQNVNTAASVGLSTENLGIGALNTNGGSPFAFSVREIAFATIGAGINSTIAASMYSDIQAYETTLARQL